MIMTMYRRKNALTIDRFIAVVLFMYSINGKAQSVYPNLCPMDYYNMDTNRIVLTEELVKKEICYTVDLGKKNATLVSDSTVQLRPCENLLCTYIGGFYLSEMKIKNRYLKRQVSKIIKKTISDGYSRSPDTRISQGFFIHITAYWGDSSPTIQMDAVSNYYMADVFDGIKRKNNKPDIFICWFRNVLVIVSCANDTVGDIIKRDFAETGRKLTVHVYKKQCEILLYGVSDGMDVHSTEYGLYRKYKLGKTRWVESY